MKYATWSAAIALLAVAALLAYLVPRSGSVGWSLLAWAIMTVSFVVGGAWQVAVHGRPGSAFLVVLGSCILARLFGAAAGAAAAVWNGEAAMRSYLTGLGFAWVPLQSFEVVWFLSKTKRSSVISS